MEQEAVVCCVANPLSGSSWPTFTSHVSWLKWIAQFLLFLGKGFSNVILRRGWWSYEVRVLCSKLIIYCHLWTLVFSEAHTYYYKYEPSSCLNASIPLSAYFMLTGVNNCSGKVKCHQDLFSCVNNHDKWIRIKSIVVLQDLPATVRLKWFFCYLGLLKQFI